MKVWTSNNTVFTLRRYRALFRTAAEDEVSMKKHNMRGGSWKVIKRAQLSDLCSIAGLSEIWEKEGITHGLKANSTEDLLRYLSDGLFVVVEETCIVGYLLGQVKSNNGLSIFDESDRSYFELEEIYIHPAFREKGLGKALINEVTDNLKIQGIERMTVSTANKDWMGIIDFYKKNGFKTWTMTLFK